MQLDEVIQRLENVQKYKTLALNNLNYWNEKILGMQEFGNEKGNILQEKLSTTLFYHYEFYDFFDKLYDWAKSNPPNPKNYGKNAVRWLRYEKGTHAGLWTMSGAYAIGLSLAITKPLLALPFLIAGGIGATSIGYCRHKTTSLEYKTDASKYISDLALYMSRDKYFNKSHPNLKFFYESMNNYAIGLNNIISTFSENGRYEEINDLQDSYIEFQTFKNQADNIINTIRKNKKRPIPSYGGGIAPAMITAESDMAIASIKRGMKNISKSNTELLR